MTPPVLLDDGQLIWIAARASGIEPERLLDNTDIAVLDNVALAVQRATDAVEQAATLLFEITRRRPFPRDNTAAAWLAATYVLRAAGVATRHSAGEVLELLARVEKSEAGVADIATALRGAATPRRLSWSCPACSRPLRYHEAEVAGVRAVLVGTSPLELMARCWYEHRVHDRHGRDVVKDTPCDDEGTRWHPVVWSPAGDACIVLAASGALLIRPAANAFHSVAVVDDLQPSELVGAWDRIIERSFPIGEVADTALRFDARRRMIDVASLPAVRIPELVHG